MAVEIERKFLLSSDRWRTAVTKSVEIVQGYITKTDSCSVRIRVAAQCGSLNLKGLTLGISRSEYECDVPVVDAREMLTEFCGTRVITKIRHHVENEGFRWEIDEFSGDNLGLVVAEIELDSESQVFIKPAWLGEEVTDDSRYYNVCLVEQPYGTWLDD